MPSGGQVPRTKYARSGDVSIAYQVFGDGPMDVIIVPGFVSHVEIFWDSPGTRRFYEHLSRFARVIAFDKRGTGMSDPVGDAPTLETRMDDMRAVLDAAGSERAALIGFSEGGAMSALFAATYPERTRALVLYGAVARATSAPDYPFGTTPEAFYESAAEFLLPGWGTGDSAEYFAPSLADDPSVRDYWGRVERYAVTPSMMTLIFEMYLAIDVRHVLPLIQVPTLVLHRTGDRIVPVQAGRWLAEHIPGARFVELPGVDHVMWAGDVDGLAGEMEQFLTGARAPAAEDMDRILATVLFCDIAGSTQRASELGDRRWRELLERYHVRCGQEIDRFRGHQVKSLGDGLLATFDGPARAIRSAQAIVASSRELGLETRAGLHAGECEVMGDDVGGIAVHIGARICSLAHAGEVLVSSTVRDLVAGSGIAFDGRGGHELKGVPGEWQLFAVSG